MLAAPITISSSTLRDEGGVTGGDISDCKAFTVDRLKIFRVGVAGEVGGLEVLIVVVGVEVILTIITWKD